MNEQQENLERVSVKIRSHVFAFCVGRIRERQPDFTMLELTAYVAERTGVAPDSPGRILRGLRQKERIDYVNTSKKWSRYRVLSVSVEREAA